MVLAHLALRARGRAVECDCVAGSQTVAIVYPPGKEMVAGSFDHHARFVGGLDFVFQQFGAGALHVSLHVTRAAANVGTFF
jgi:hypothetical protein